MKAIVNAKVVMPDHVIENGVILIDGDTIAEVGKARDIKVPEGAEIIDAEGAFVGPGLIDIHTHAAGGVYFTEDPVFCGKELLKHGVTSVLPALYYSLDKNAFVAYLTTEQVAENALSIGYSDITDQINKLIKEL